MEHYHEDDLTRVKELLRHTSEFMAYFELAETKMIEWRQEMDEQAARLREQSLILQQDLTAVQDLFSQAGVDNFRITAEKTLSQGQNHVQTLERTSEQFRASLEKQHHQLHALTEQCIAKLELQSAQTSQYIATQLAKYDVHQFHRIANESCDHVARVAHDAVNKSNKLLSTFQLRFGFFAIMTTLLTAFVIVLYLSGELPWEMHHQAMSEREAGKVLLQAWPNLSQEEKSKILNNDDGAQHDG